MGVTSKYSNYSTMGVLGGFCHFIYDSETNTVLGRTFESWLKITIFYAIYYTCIGAFAYYFIEGYQTHMMVLPGAENARPSTQNRVATPGLATFPMLEKIELDANRQNAITYMNDINDYLMQYANSSDKTVSATVSPAKLGHCSPVCLSKDCEETPLLASYANGQPCIVYQLNKVLGWRPFPIESLNAEFIQPRDPKNEDFSMVGKVVPKYETDKIYVYCYDLDVAKGYRTDIDEPRFTVKYYSSDSGESQDHSYGYINTMRYPMANPGEETNAFVAMQVTVKEQYYGELINVACQAYAGGLSPNQAQNAAMANTVLRVEAAGESTAVKINEAYHNERSTRQIQEAFHSTK